MRQSVKWEVWPYRTCAFIVVAFRLRTTVDGSLQGVSTATTGRRETMQLVVRGSWWPV